MKLNEKFRYIVIEGNIGAGKTSLARRIAADTGSNLLLEEFAENTFLQQFYNDPAKYAFPLELSFLASRYKQLRNYFDQPDSLPVISDYHLIKSFLFAGHNLSEAEFELYKSFYEIVSPQFPEPDVVIYLDPGVHRLRKNIIKRGRDFEKGISEEYLSGIHSSYQKILKNYPFSRLILIDSENMDFVNNQNDYQFIINKLKS